MLNWVYFGLILRLGGPTVAGSSGRGLLRIRSRRLGGRATGGTGSSRLYRVVMVLVVLFPHFIHAFSSGCLIPLRC